MPSIWSMQTLMVSSDMAGEMGGVGVLSQRGETVPLGGRGVLKCSSCSGLSGTMLSPRGRGIGRRGSMCSLRGMGSGASSMHSESGRDEVEMRGEEMVGGMVDIWIRLMVIEWGRTGEFL
jgi:hypothetical protein